MKRLDATRDPLLSLSGKVKRDGGEKEGMETKDYAREREREKGDGRVKEFAQRLAGNYGVIM